MGKTTLKIPRAPTRELFLLLPFFPYSSPTPKEFGNVHTISFGFRFKAKMSSALRKELYLGALGSEVQNAASYHSADDDCDYAHLNEDTIEIERGL